MRKLTTLLVIVAVIASISYAVKRTATMNYVLAKQAETTKTDTFDDFLNRKIEEYKKSPEFKAEHDKAINDTEAQLDKLAKLRITNAVLTRIEQQGN